MSEHMAVGMGIWLLAWAYGCWHGHMPVCSSIWRLLRRSNTLPLGTEYLTDRVTVINSFKMNCSF